MLSIPGDPNDVILSCNYYDRDGETSSICSTTRFLAG